MKFSVGDKDAGDFHLKYNWNNALTLTVLVKCLTMKFNTVELLGFPFPLPFPFPFPFAFPLPLPYPYPLPLLLPFPFGFTVR